jgi:hypothetical protein
MKFKNISTEAKILSAVGGPVNFTYPAGEGNKNGILKSRSIHKPKGKTKVPYWDVVDQIEFSDEKEKLWLRIGYYRKSKDRLVWGSQTTICEPISIWKELLIKAAKEKSWFRELIEEVHQSL